MARTSMVLAPSSALRSSELSVRDMAHSARAHHAVRSSACWRCRMVRNTPYNASAAPTTTAIGVMSEAYGSMSRTCVRPPAATQGRPGADATYQRS